MNKPEVLSAAAAGDLQPLVSVIVTTFNRKGLLAETIAAIRAQTYTRLEVIIVDNASSDGTEEYVHTIDDDRIKYFCHENNGIIAVNRNYGISHANGEFVAFCDDDDRWMPEKIEMQLREFFRYPMTVVVAANLLLFSGNVYYGLALKKPPRTKRTPLHIMAQGGQLALSSVLARRDAIVAAGGFSEAREFFAIEDFDMWLRLALAGGEVRILPQALVEYRIHAGQSSSRDRRETIRKIRLAFKSLYQKETIGGYFYLFGSFMLFARFLEASCHENLKKSRKLVEWIYRFRSFRYRNFKK